MGKIFYQTPSIQKLHLRICRQRFSQDTSKSSVFFSNFPSSFIKTFEILSTADVDTKIMKVVEIEANDTIWVAEKSGRLTIYDRNLKEVTRRKDHREEITSMAAHKSLVYGSGKCSVIGWKVGDEEFADVDPFSLMVKEVKTMREDMEWMKGEIERLKRNQSVEKKQ